MAPRRTVGDRITTSRVPVNGSIDPRENPVAWVTTIMSVLAVLPADLSMTVKLIIVALAIAAGIATQFFTVPSAEVVDHDGPPRRRPGGRLG